MKKRLISAALLGLSLHGFAQIQVLPYDTQVKCDVEQLSTLAYPKATSTCGEVATVFSDLLFSGGCLGTIERSYVFTDACGNVSKAQVYISLTDQTPPVAQKPADITCKGNEIPEPAPITASDNSNEPVDIAFDVIRESGGLTRQWTCTDRCGNQTVVTQKITFVK
ncbi:MAG: hypothetical protein ACOVOO_03315 [Flavobacteriales bacterium]|jgi:hypothetical protein